MHLWKELIQGFQGEGTQQKVYIRSIYSMHVRFTKKLALSYGYPMDILRLSYGEGSGCAL